MLKVKDSLDLFLFSLFNLLLFLLFLLNIPLLREPHGVLVMDDLSDFSSHFLVNVVFWGSVVVCALLGVLMMELVPALTAGMMANLMVTTFFLLWVDSIFALSTQFLSLHYLGLLGVGILFLYIFFFILNYFGFPVVKPPPINAPPLKRQWMRFTLGSWMVFYFIVSWLLVFNSFGDGEIQTPLAVGFWMGCFLNYLLVLFLKKSRGEEIAGFSRVGRIVFIIWFLGLVLTGVGQKYFH